VTDGESRLAALRGGVRDLVIDLVKLLPLRLSLPLLFRGGAREAERSRSVRDGDRELEYEDPVYDE
jgi:hypothetical protein